MPSSSERERLATYHAKRDLRASGEPGGSAGRGAADEPRFVIQRHEARRLHYDFRLEIDGVLVSWAVPRGPSTDPSEKRFATRTEDHPLDYLDFEGRIPRGNYGAGTVVVWDIGTYRNLTERRGRPVSAADALANGHLKVWLSGHKLTGAYALTRARFRDDEDSWLLVKVADEAADRRRDPVRTQPESVLTGKVNKDFED
ncbi:DNA polymerase ligase N-terminal domain-containing protein [Goodfellowiella coeruleoviolacea]|uniref:DNA ligase D, 3'-phosphoesterase domain-containing protein n=1 Tax=Goodfellowiella coeruleoviolacea TaxID=334858 RepID=A0AAE3GFD5_9PSEU|nr:DNA polymerase ligase N-terminal domain-containing protein [Goodfellowiella coeruleoviolacea]MCP2167231.1 DNA ligase D, 3'-phosphoesterase domain-containing protein [Goodfellowiella coeruleoviolacea]